MVFQRLTNPLSASELSVRVKVRLVYFILFAFMASFSSSMVRGRHLPQSVSKSRRMASSQLTADFIFGYVCAGVFDVAFTLMGGSVFTVSVATVLGFTFSKALCTLVIISGRFLRVFVTSSWVPYISTSYSPIFTRNANFSGFSSTFFFLAVVFGNVIPRYTRMLCFLGFVSFEIFLNRNIVLYSETQ